MSLVPVDEAVARVVAGVEPTDTEIVALDAADGRILAEPLRARRTQPPFPASAMDGYAVRSQDLQAAGTKLRLIGQSAAGHGFRGSVGANQAVRIFTGAPVPEGADAILIQEDAAQSGEDVVAAVPLASGTYVRPAGLDFQEGGLLLEAGTRLQARALSVAAAGGFAELPVRRAPKVAILPTGDELVLPGMPTGPDQIVASNQVGIAAEVRRAGGLPIDLGIAPDDRGAIARRIADGIAQGAEIIVTLGGASVGEHDLVAASLGDAGMSLDFWKIAMRPGKPLMFGTIGTTRVLGFPGNPVSSLVCSILFLRPLLAAKLGTTPVGTRPRPAILGGRLRANDQRQDYLRARAEPDGTGRLVATAFDRQDSSMLSVHAQANALIVRQPFAPAAEAGSPCDILVLDD